MKKYQFLLEKLNFRFEKPVFPPKTEFFHQKINKLINSKHLEFAWFALPNAEILLSEPFDEWLFRIEIFEWSRFQLIVSDRGVHGGLRQFACLEYRL